MFNSYLTPWRNGSASDSRSEGCVFKSCQGQKSHFLVIFGVKRVKRCSSWWLRFYGADLKMWNASRFCVSSLRRGHANLLCIVPILVYVQPRLVHCPHSDHHYCCGNCNAMIDDKKKFGRNSLFKNYWITAQGLLKWLAGRLACSYNPATWEARTWTGMRRGVLIALDSCWIGVRTKASINMAL